MAELVLTRQGAGTAATLFYAPAAGSRFAFLLWSKPATPPESIEAGETAGVDPAYAGWFVFGPAAAGWTSALEATLREKLDPPALTSFAWFDPQANPVVAGRIDAVASTGDSPRPVAANDAIFAGQVEVGAGSPIELLTSPVTAFGFTYPPIAGVPESRGSAFAVHLEGDVAGTFRFTGLYPFEPGVENIADVSVDPLAPGDPARTFIRFTGRTVLLRDAGDHYELDPA